MLTTHTINVNVSDDTQKILDGLGLSVSDAVNIFLDRIDTEGGLPFDLKENDMQISDDEILRKLEEAEESFKAGRFYSEEEFFERMEKLYNV